MNIEIGHSFYLNNFSTNGTAETDSGGFQEALDSILSGNVLISPKYESQLLGDSELAQAARQQLSEKLKEMGGELENSILVVNRRGEVTRYDLSKKDDMTSPTAEELKAVARARARKKARLDAYFHLLERVSIKRKLIEQENARRFLNKKYRFSSTSLDTTARARQITSPPLNPDYYF